MKKIFLCSDARIIASSQLTTQQPFKIIMTLKKISYDPSSKLWQPHYSSKSRDCILDAGQPTCIYNWLQLPQLCDCILWYTYDHVVCLMNMLTCLMTILKQSYNWVRSYGTSKYLCKELQPKFQSQLRS